MYKILYLPFGEDVLVCTEEERFTKEVLPFIKKNKDPSKSCVGLRMPGYRERKTYSKFDTAIFEDKKTAWKWIEELINRDEVKAAGDFRKEYFELIKVQ